MSATYRVQLRGPASDPDNAFTFADAAAQVPYFQRLGVTHLYLSPILTAAPESTHNYDVTDPTTVNPELGGIEGFRALVETCREAGLKVVVDIVPNHVGVATPKLNAWWWDVLKRGQDSEYASYFDIDWSPDNGAEGRLGMPVLGSHEDVAALSLATDGGPGGDETVLRYYEHEFPVAEGTATEGDSPQQVHDRQHYKLMYWRDGIIDYRRFFSVNDLAGLRQEDPIVFEHTHRVLNQLVAADLIDGIRVDHPDGLADPFKYLQKLRALIGPDRWLIVEKILGVSEPLDPRLDVDGTTGYDALREFDGVFIHRPSMRALSDIAEKHTGSRWNRSAFLAAQHDLKAEVAAEELDAEIRRLARAVRNDNWSTSGDAVSAEELRDTLIELVASMPVYRADYESLSRVTSTAIAHMAIDKPHCADALDLIATALISRREANVRFAQVCGAVMAKGVEDTAFYRGSRLVSLQEVGGAPQRYGVSPAEFHLLQAERARLWPRTMTSLSTHDTKRGEDVRSRITCIAEVPEEFAALCDGIHYPDGTTGHFLLQNIIGVWPEDGAVSDSLRTRLHDYATKAMREAGLHSTWFDPDEDFERSIQDWIDELIDSPVYHAAITSFVRRIAWAGREIGISKKLLQLLGPGVPDIYQGTEFHTDYLVDPDNRRKVDYAARQAALDRIGRGAIDSPDHEKLHIISTALRIRKNIDPAASYLPVMASGEKDRYMLGMMRGEDMIALVTRQPIGLKDAGGWGDTTVALPAGIWEDQLNRCRVHEGQVRLDDLFSARGQALLTRMTTSN
ncbi:Maltooligosyl trehalose synthase [Corynebacterium heidelbergense]|nr:malto-oligosyltrehalose synthase [Corynebacterium heidelbergense]WCZ36397.1 Maltooligosyl trehalose synthase [Corynebacterium heidelbergense]